MAWEDRVSDKVARTGVGCLVGAVTFGVAYLFTGLAGLLERVTAAPAIESQILRQKPVPTVGSKIATKTCLKCGNETEAIQLFCHHCGNALRTSWEFQEDMLSPLQARWIVFVIVLLIMIAISNSADPFSSFMGSFGILATGAWGVSLLITTVRYGLGI